MWWNGQGQPPATVVRAVVLAPTRELAMQIQQEALKLVYGSELRAVVLYGGAKLTSQLSEVARGADILVATPGRLSDVESRGVISLAEAQFAVLDEADRMLDMGFEPQVRDISGWRI